ncbi:MAG: LamG domain-containing protein [Patescibacteria group bacterium]|nr:LamG domain-containing protein [Patescibacteria group bacterium]
MFGIFQKNSTTSFVRNTQGFTLMELLIAISIIAIVVVLALVVLQPVEYFRRGRDAQRSADLNSLSALIARQTYAGPRITLGSPQIVYISLPDASSTCGSWTALPVLPAGWAYHCATTAAYRNIDGTGWLPVDVSGLHTISSLPLDPTNDTNHFYVYVVDANKKYVLTALFESEKNIKTVASQDGGTDDARYEVGTNMALWGSAGSVTGNWKLAEGSGFSAANSASSTPATLSSYVTWTSAKNTGYALRLPDGNSWVNLNNTLSAQGFSLAFWVYPYAFNNPGGYGVNGNVLFAMESYTVSGFRSGFDQNGLFAFWTVQSGGTINLPATTDASLNTWSFYVVTYDGTTAKMYRNGSLENTTTGTFVTPSGPTYINNGVGGVYWANTALSGIRVYSRAISSQEVQALYLQGK